MGNKKANKQLRAIGAIIKMGSNAAQGKGVLAKAIENSDWIGNILSDTLVGSLFGGATSLSYGLLSNEYDWHF